MGGRVSTPSSKSHLARDRDGTHPLYAYLEMVETRDKRKGNRKKNKPTCDQKGRTPYVIPVPGTQPLYERSLAEREAAVPGPRESGYNGVQRRCQAMIDPHLLPCLVPGIVLRSIFPQPPED